jgi:N-acetylglucosamine-6-phosphate deacetylase
LRRFRVVTLAPEADPEGDVARWLRTQHIRVQLGHTLADYETAALWLRERADGVTHLFNAMGGIHHRRPGCTGAALAFARDAELICDRLHVSDGAVMAALRAIPNLYAVTDATAASGMPDGAYRLGKPEVIKSGQAVRLRDGTLAGSCLTMDKAFKNLVSMGLSAQDAAKRTSTIPARHLNEVFYGTIQVGSCAVMMPFDFPG